MVILDTIFNIIVPSLILGAIIYSLAFVLIVRLGTISTEQPSSNDSNAVPNDCITFFDKRASIPLRYFLYFYNPETLWLLINKNNNESNVDCVAQEMRRKALEDILACEEVRDIEQGENNVCGICLIEQEAGDLCISCKVCQHQFHKDCLLEWLGKSWDNTSCPSCRQKLVNSDEIIAQIAVNVTRGQNNHAPTKNYRPLHSLSEKLDVEILPTDEANNYSEFVDLANVNANSNDGISSEVTPYRSISLDDESHDASNANEDVLEEKYSDEYQGLRISTGNGDCNDGNNALFSS